MKGHRDFRIPDTKLALDLLDGSHVREHEIELTSNSIPCVGLGIGAFDADLEPIETASDKTLQIRPLQAQAQVRRGKDLDVPALRVRHHLWEFFVEKRLAPVIEIQVEKVRPELVEHLFVPPEIHRHSGSHVQLQTCRARWTTKVAIECRLRVENHRTR